MITWWSNLDAMMKVLWCITLVSSLIFIIETVLTFIGADVDGGIDGIDADIDDPSAIDGGSNLYTFRNLVNFCLGFGWTSVLMHDKISSVAVLMVVAIIVGVALVAAVMYIFKFLNSMQQNGTIDVYKSAVGCQGKAYLAIPAERGGIGKVQITINNSVREYDAVTDGEAIPTGAAVTVIEVVNASTLLVESNNSLII